MDASVHLDVRDPKQPSGGPHRLALLLRLLDSPSAGKVGGVCAPAAVNVARRAIHLIADEQRFGQ